MLMGAIAASREHFQREEDEIFPLLERRFGTAELLELGEAWRQRFAAGILRSSKPRAPRPTRSWRRKPFSLGVAMLTERPRRMEQAHHGSLV